MLFPDAYASLKELAFAKKNQAEILARYVEKEWYKKHNDCSWYDSHKSSEYIYYAYWSFEAAVVAKLLGIDDSELKGKRYDPYDLAHFFKEFSR